MNILESIDQLTDEQRSVLKKKLLERNQNSSADASFTRLVAYIKLKSGPKGLETRSLKKHLNSNLPDYMIPATFQIQESFPVTPNGKVDRKALPIPAFSRDQSSGAFAAPQSKAEKKITEIWSEFLQMDEIGIHDNFFELGGHSLVAAQVMRRIHAALDTKLPLIELFRSPTIAGLALKITSTENNKDPNLAVLEHVSRDQRLPLSFAQQRLWFIDQLQGSSPEYNMTLALDLSGTLDIKILENSLNRIIARHESLRTRIVKKQNEPEQEIIPSVRISLDVLDLSTQDSKNQDSLIQDVLKDFHATAFDLARAPLIRAKVIRKEKQKHLLAITCHHVVADGWSWGIICRELTHYYDTLTAGQTPGLSELPLHYADFAVWQRNWLQGPELEKQLNYWRNKLANPTTLELPTDFKRPAIQSNRGDCYHFSLSTRQSRQLNTFAQQEHITHFMAFLAVFKALLHRYTGQVDLLIGTPVANRGHSQLESQVGFFINNLVLRTDLSSGPGFIELVHRIRDTVLDAFEYQDLPFEKIVEELNPQRDLGKHPLFQVTLSVVNDSIVMAGMGDLKVSRSMLPPTTVHFDLEWDLWLESNAWHGSISYNTDLFKASTIERFAQHFITLLDSMLKEPGRPVGELPMLSGSERTRLLNAWNPKPITTDASGTIHQKFEHQVNLHPNSVAVKLGSESESYSKLNNQANRLAHFLREQGVGPDTLVGVCMERSIDLLVALLGILKSGGAYLPIDLAYPKDRLSFMMEDADAKMLLTQTHLLSKLPTSQAAVIPIDDPSLPWWSGPARNLDTIGNADNLAYVIYTSGSTGQPKGVGITHKNVLRLFDATKNWFHFGSEDIWCLYHSYAFDFSVWEIWGALLHGGRLVIVPYETSRSPKLFNQLLSDERVTVLNQTPSAFKQLSAYITSQSAEEEKALALRWVIFGGEALDVNSLEPWFNHFGDEKPKLVNMYGITETTVHVTYRPLSKKDLYGGSVIGEPIPDLQLYILDANLEPAPIGIPGEIYVGGAGLARGYLNRPELTRERFINDPFTDKAQSRLYRTGDLAKRLSDGEIEYLGRIDQQVQLRGFRVELGEIENVLLAHPMVRDTRVLLGEYGPEDSRLVAFVVARANSIPTPTELRHYLSEKLPEYMVPSAFAFLESFPLTPNGKINLQALPLPDMDRAQSGREYVAPSSPVEIAISGIWSEILHIENPGVHDNFFDLGGHSMLAVKVITRIQSRLNTELSLRDLFRTPTIAGLAKSLDGSKAQIASSQTGKKANLAAAAAIPSKPRHLSVSFSQYRLWFLKQLEGDLSAYNMPVALKLEGELNYEALRKAFQAVVERHEPFRTNIKAFDGDPVQVIQPPGPFALPVIDLSGFGKTKQESEIRQKIGEECQTDFDLESDLMLRAKLLHLSDEDHVLLMTQHHIASDGWSQHILNREIETIYQACCSHQDPDLPTLPIQYADYAVLQQKKLQGGTLARLVDYWKNQLKGIAPLMLPCDRPRPIQLSKQGAAQSSQIDESVVTKLRGIARSQCATLQSTLLAAFTTLLSRLSGQDDITVGMPSAGRSAPEVENLIGYFLNTLVVRADSSGDPTFLEFLNRMQETSLAALEHQELPFEMLVDELQPERDLSRNPLFQVLVNIWEDEKSRALELPDLDITELSTNRANNKFDLTLYVDIRGNQVFLNLVYSTDLFNKGRMTIMLEQFSALLNQIAEDPRKSIHEYSLLAGAVPFNTHDIRSQIECPPQESIHALFFECAKRYGNETAIRFNDKNTSYEELGQQVEKLASALIQSGLKPGDRIMVEGRKNVGCMVGLLGCLAAGGVMVPIDADLPNAGKRSMLSQTKATWLIHFTETDSDSWWQSSEIKLKTIQLGSQDGRLRNPDTTKPLKPDWFEPDSNAPAYIFFTSGTTGEPKGILGRHAGLSHFVKWQRDQFSIGAGDRVSNLTSLSFDVVLREIFLTLTSGACLCLPKPGFQVLDVETLDWLDRECISVLHTVPSIMDTWLRDSANPRSLEKIRWTFSAGEPLLDKLSNRWRQIAPNGEIINLYGPTETTLAKCWYPVPENPPRGVQPIGIPLPETGVHILDNQLREKGIGEPGEIVVRTPFRSLGYLDPSGSDSKRFIPNPYTRNPRDLLYRTGDQGRLRPDGNMDILGRLDDQVKIRGIRIEPRAVESVMETHPAVNACRVLGLKDENQHSFLAAYFVASHPLKRDELHSHLSASLPSSMIPSAFIQLESIPLTPNGKLDRKALPSPENSRPELNVEYTAHRDPVEAQLAQLFAEVLGIEKVGIHDNFFHLGGNSLLSIRLSYKISKQFGKSLQVARIFEKPTIAQLASFIQNTTGEESYSMRMGGGERGDPVFFMPGITRNALVFQKVVDHFKMSSPCYGVELPIPRNGMEPHPTLKDIAAHCVTEIKKIQPKGPYRLVGFSFGGLLAFETARQLQDPALPLNKLALFDAWQRQERNHSLVDRLAWMSQMLLQGNHRYVVFLTKKIWYATFGKLGWMSEPKDYGVTEVLTGGIEPLNTDVFHYNYSPEPFPVEMMVFTTRESEFSISSGPLLQKWKYYCLGKLRFERIDVDYHNQIFDETLLGPTCNRLEEFLKN